jgi:hypothetical protein
MLWVPALACAAEAPEAVYAKFHRAVVAGDFNEMIKYGTAKQAAETRAMPPAARQAALELVRRLMPKTYSLAGKRIETDERMTLRLVSQGAGGISSGTARMQMENGEWKVDEVNWGGGTAARTASAAPPAVAGSGAQGRINGAAFTVEKASLRNGILELRQGKEFFAERGFTLFLFLDGPPDGLTKRIGPQEHGVHVHMGYKVPGRDVPKTEVFTTGNQLFIEFQKRQGNVIRGRIELRLPGKAQSYVSGSFEAEVR